MDCGEIKEIDVPMDRGQNRGFAFVEFSSAKGVQKALLRDGH